jgi:hypothetical protein
MRRSIGGSFGGGDPSPLSTKGRGMSEIEDANVLWFIPTHGDGRYFGASFGGRAVDFAYLRQIAETTDALGYCGVLLPTGKSCEDSCVVPHLEEAYRFAELVMPLLPLAHKSPRSVARRQHGPVRRDDRQCRPSDGDTRQPIVNAYYFVAPRAKLSLPEVVFLRDWRRRRSGVEGQQRAVALIPARERSCPRQKWLGCLLSFRRSWSNANRTCFGDYDAHDDP